MEQPQPLPQIPSPCTRSCGANSPEFEFWMVGNPSFPQPNLPSADELFSGGFLLPLHLLPLPQPTGSDKPPEPEPEPEPSTFEPAELSPNSKSNSKRWRRIFKKKLVSSISTRPEDESNKEKREKKNGGAGFGAGNHVVSAAELNINIWPFSRSRSAGNAGARPRAAVAPARKVSSAPCSRSNSTGESKSRKLPPHSPNRAAGVHLGRNSPVWQLRRGVGRSNDGGNEGRRKFPASKATGLSLKVPTCIGYRSHLEVAAAAGGSEIEGEVSGEVVPRSNLFKIRSLFTKKVH